MAFRWHTAVCAVVLSIMLVALALPAIGLPVNPTLIAAAQPLDTDGDGQPDSVDNDDDGDQVDDWADYAPLDKNVQYPPPPSTNPPGQSPGPVATNLPDFDGDGIPDNADFDDDNDGVVDSDDYDPYNFAVQYPPAAPVSPGGSNPPPNSDTGNDDDQDTDRDGIPNHLDPDDDNDEVEDGDDPVQTPHQEESNPPATGGTDQKQDSEPINRDSSASMAVPLVSSLPKTGSGSESALPVLAIVVIAGLGILGVHFRSKNPSER